MKKLTRNLKGSNLGYGYTKVKQRRVALESPYGYFTRLAAALSSYYCWQSIRSTPTLVQLKTDGLYYFLIVTCRIKSCTVYRLADRLLEYYKFSTNMYSEFIYARVKYVPVSRRSPTNISID